MPDSWLGPSLKAAVGGAEEELVEEEATWSAGAVSCSPNSMSVRKKTEKNGNKIPAVTNTEHRNDSRMLKKKIKKKKFHSCNI